MLPNLNEPAPFLEGKALSNWLRTDGASIFSLFDTTAAAIRYIRENLGSVSDSTFYRIRKQVTDVINSAKLIENYPADNRIPKAWHVTDHGLELTTTYQYRIKSFGIDAKSGALKAKWQSIASNRQLTPNQVREMAREWNGENIIGKGSGIGMYDGQYADIEILAME